MKYIKEGEVMCLLKLENVSYVSEGKKILDNISIEISKGDFISVVGSSGSGKSTFFKLCAHLISPSEGNISYNNKSFYDYNPTELRKSIAYCFQNPYLFGDTVMDNLKFPFEIRNEKADAGRIKFLLESFSLNNSILNEKVQKLSGGEKQRVSLIRTLLFKPEILLLDEVTSALDVDNTAIVEEAIKRLNSEGITIMWITHNPEQSKRCSNKILTIENGEIKKFETQL